MLQIGLIKMKIIATKVSKCLKFIYTNENKVPIVKLMIYHFFISAVRIMGYTPPGERRGVPDSYRLYTPRWSTLVPKGGPREFLIDRAIAHPDSTPIRAHR